jgi:hypothetical protein
MLLAWGVPGKEPGATGRTIQEHFTERIRDARKVDFYLGLPDDQRPSWPGDMARAGEQTAGGRSWR